MSLRLWICALGIVHWAFLAGCAKAQAKTIPDGPPLEMPAPPPRMLALSDEPIVAEPSEPTDPPPAPATTTRRPVRRPTAEAEPKPEPPPAEPPLPPAAAPVDPRPATEPTRTLRAPGRDSEEKPIRDRLSMALRDLSRVDYARLSQDGRTQYEQSKRFIQQAEQALKETNFVFARTLADKAATLAGELLGR